MNVIKSVVNCACCDQVLNNPVLLACGELICENHTKENQIFCRRCYEYHENKANVMSSVHVKAIERLLNAKFDQLNFGNTYHDVNASCRRLSDLIDEIKSMNNDPSKIIHEKICEIKASIDLKREELKQQVDIKAEELLKKLDDYEIECNTQLKTDTFMAKLSPLIEMVESTEKILKLMDQELNLFKIDEKNWKLSDQKNQEMYKTIKEKMQLFVNNDLLMDRYNSFVEERDKFNRLKLFDSKYYLILSVFQILITYFVKFFEFP